MNIYAFVSESFTTIAQSGDEIHILKVVFSLALPDPIISIRLAQRGELMHRHQYCTDSLVAS